MSQQHVVLVHGAWHGGWCWNPIGCGQHIIAAKPQEAADVLLEAAG
jgi:hypothetical protein